MKIFPAVTVFVVLGFFMAAAAFGQVTQIWAGGLDGAQTGTDIGRATNWGGSIPLPDNGDTAEWNGTVPGNLSLVYDTPVLSSGLFAVGLNLYLNTAQTGSVSISTSLATSPNLDIMGIFIDEGAGAFTLGGAESGRMLVCIGRPAGAVHPLINNSTNTATLSPWLGLLSGGGATCQFDFSGTGNWQVDNFLVDINGPSKSIQIDGPGTVTWNPVGSLGAAGIDSPININAGTLVLKNFHPRLKTQAITLNGNFIFASTNLAATQILSGIISGSGTLTVNSGTLTLTGTNTCTGSTTISNGTLAAIAVGGDLNVLGGTLAPAAIGSTSTLTVASNLNISVGSILMTLNKSLAQSNSFISVSGSINYASGTMKLTNAGPGFAVGDKFTLFNKPVPGGGAMPIISPGFTVANNLAIDGSVTVTSFVQPPSPTLNTTLTIDGANVVIMATNNTGTNGRYSLLATNDLAAPLTAWPVLRTGTFDSTGSLSLTNPMGTNQQFFILRVP